MRKNNLSKEAILATILIIIFTYFISFIPWSLEYGKALHQGFADFDLYDLKYAGKAQYNKNFDTSIVLVEVGNTRSEIADEINLLCKYHPKVLALDVILKGPNPNVYDTSGDQRLANAIQGKSNLVLAYQVLEAGKMQPNYFIASLKAGSTGYVNFSGNKNSVIRSYPPSLKIGDLNCESFSSAIVRMYDQDKYKILQKKDHDQLLINYSEDIHNYITISHAALYDFEKEGELDNVLRGKIVIIGFFVNQENGFPPLLMEDLSFTPMNEIVSGKSFPDMYGVVIHANIISMILNKNYTTLAPVFLSYLFAFLATYAFIYLMVYEYHKKEHPRHAFLIIIQLVSILVLLYLFLQVFSIFHYKVPLEPIMISMVLSLELLGLYKTLALWLHKKYQYQTIFIHKRII